MGEVRVLGPVSLLDPGGSLRSMVSLDVWLTIAGMCAFFLLLGWWSPWNG